MKAIQITGSESLMLSEVEKPEIGPGEALIRVRAASICGSDVRMFRNGYPGATPETPLTLGHEFAGVIEKIDDAALAAAPNLIPGARVSVAPNWGCGTCDACVSGNTHLCATYQAFGINAPGGFAEYVRVPAAALSQGNVAIVPNEMSFEEAALIEPLSCVYNGQEICGIEPGDTVVVVGAGPIGIMHAMLAQAKGAGVVAICDFNEKRVAQASQLMPDVVALPGGNLCDQVMELTDGHGANVSIVAAPSPEAQAESFSYMAMNGRCLFFGGLPKDRSHVSIDANQIHYKQLRIFGSTRSSIRQYRTCLKLVASGRLPLERLVTHRFTLDQYEEAFEAAAMGAGLKCVFEMSV